MWVNFCESIFYDSRDPLWSWPTPSPCLCVFICLKVTRKEAAFPCFLSFFLCWWWVLSSLLWGAWSRNNVKHPGLKGWATGWNLTRNYLPTLFYFVVYAQLIWADGCLRADTLSVYLLVHTWMKVHSGELPRLLESGWWSSSSSISDMTTKHLTAWLHKILCLLQTERLRAFICCFVCFISATVILFFITCWVFWLQSNIWLFKFSFQHELTAQIN